MPTDERNQFDIAADAIAQAADVEMDNYESAIGGLIRANRLDKTPKIQAPNIPSPVSPLSALGAALRGGEAVDRLQGLAQQHGQMQAQAQLQADTVNATQEGYLAMRKQRRDSQIAELRAEQGKIESGLIRDQGEIAAAEKARDDAKAEAIRERSRKRQEDIWKAEAGFISGEAGARWETFREMLNHGTILRLNPNTGLLEGINKDGEITNDPKEIQALRDEQWQSLYDRTRLLLYGLPEGSKLRAEMAEDLADIVEARKAMEAKRDTMKDLDELEKLRTAESRARKRQFEAGDFTAGIDFGKVWDRVTSSGPDVPLVPEGPGEQRFFDQQRNPEDVSGIVPQGPGDDELVREAALNEMISDWREIQTLFDEGVPPDSDFNPFIPGSGRFGATQAGGTTPSFSRQTFIGNLSEREDELIKGVSSINPSLGDSLRQSLEKPLGSRLVDEGLIDKTE